MIRFILQMFCIGLIVAATAKENLSPDGEDDDFAEREERYLNTIARYSNDSSEEAIEKLGTIVRWTADENTRGVRQYSAFKHARERLFEIPGFADHFKRKILEMSAWENGESTVQILGDRAWYFQTLAQLPHPDSVRVLGELLYDDRGIDKGRNTDCPYVSNSVNAAYTLANIGLKNPAVGQYRDAREDLHAWRLWFEQVQHGKPFSFKGDERIYRLADRPDAPQRLDRRQRPEGDGTVVKESRTKSMDLYLILGLLGLAVAIAASKLMRKSGAA